MRVRRRGEAMLAHKRIPHRVVRLMPGLHPLLVRFAGFEGYTVPALELEGRKLQGTRRIARFLDSVRPEPPLFPADREQRVRVEEAERWASGCSSRSRAASSATCSNERARAARAVAPLFLPVIRHLASVSHADEARVRDDIARLPELLDHVDRLIAGGVIGAAEPNAADFQILASVGVLRAFADVGDRVLGRPCEAAARRLYPDWPTIPSGLPAG